MAALITNAQVRVMLFGLRRCRAEPQRGQHGGPASCGMQTRSQESQASAAWLNVGPDMAPEEGPETGAASAASARPLRAISSHTSCASSSESSQNMTKASAISEM